MPKPCPEFSGSFSLSVSLSSESSISQDSRQGPSGNMALVTCHLQETWDGLRGGSFTLSSPTGVYIPICCDQGNLLAQWRSHLHLAQYSPKVSHHAWGKPVCSSAGMSKIGLSLLSLPLDSRCLGLPDSFPRPPLATLFYFPLKMLPASHSGSISHLHDSQRPPNVTPLVIDRHPPVSDPTGPGLVCTCLQHCALSCRLWK